MRRKATKNTRAANAEEKRFMGYTKECDCVVCGNLGPSVVDHCYGQTYRHMKTLVGHWLVIPLCVECDSVKTIGSCKAFRNQFGSLAGLWIEHINASGFRAPDDVYDAIFDLSINGR